MSQHYKLPWGNMVFVSGILLAAASGLVFYLFLRDHQEFGSCRDREICDLARESGVWGESGHGKGAAFVDIDNDGWEDIFDGNTIHPDGSAEPKIFLNQGNGTFRMTDLKDLGIDLRQPCMVWGAAFADYDNDSDQDMLAASGGYCGDAPLILFKNMLKESGTLMFIAISGNGITEERHRWWGASFADYDRDGWLDFAAVDRVGRAWIYHNLQDGTFEETAHKLGVDVSFQDGKNPVWFDYDLDKDPDLYLAGTDTHALYRNDNDRFTDVTKETLSQELFTDNSFEILFGVSNPEKKPMPVVWAAASSDFNQDGWPDLYLGRQFLQDLVFVNHGDGTFKGYGREAGLDMLTFPERYENTMGLNVGDINEDGFPDVLIGSGDPWGGAPPLTFCNTSEFPRMFKRCGKQIAESVGKKQTHGIIVGDPDHDGDADIFYNVGGMVPRQNMPLNVEDSHYRNVYFVREPKIRPNTATIHLIGIHSNRDAIGAEIAVRPCASKDAGFSRLPLVQFFLAVKPDVSCAPAGVRTHYYNVQSMQGFQSQSSNWILVSLGSANSAEVAINWPSGKLTTVVIHSGERIVVKETP